MSSDNNHLRIQYEALLKENKQLKGVVEKLEKENHDLKRSVYELSLKYVRVLCHLTYMNHLCRLDSTVKPVSNSGGSNASSSLSSVEGPSVFNANDLLAKDSTTETVPSYLESLNPSVDEDDKQANNRIFFQKSELRGHGGNSYLPL